MRYFEVFDPYYALIQAESQEEAIAIYQKDVASEEISLSGKIREVNRDWALIIFSGSFSRNAIRVPVTKILEEFNNTHNQLLLVDSGLI